MSNINCERMRYWKEDKPQALACMLKKQFVNIYVKEEEIFVILWTFVMVF